eukprot:6195457-Pleurochrysis_carterae.AAC.4
MLRLGTALLVSRLWLHPSSARLVEYLDDDLCVFVFPLSATRIAAVREGGLLDVWRQGDHFGNEPFKDQHTV